MSSPTRQRRLTTTVPPRRPAQTSSRNRVPVAVRRPTILHRRPAAAVKLGRRQRLLLTPLVPQLPRRPHLRCVRHRPIRATRSIASHRYKWKASIQPEPQLPAPVQILHQHRHDPRPYDLMHLQPVAIVTTRSATRTTMTMRNATK